MSRRIECTKCGAMNKSGNVCKCYGGSDQRLVFHLNIMAKSTAQKDAANLWRQEQQEEEWAEESRSKGRYLQKWLRDIGDMKHPEAEAKLREIKKLADELKNLLENAELRDRHLEQTPPEKENVP